MQGTKMSSVFTWPGFEYCVRLQQSDHIPHRSILKDCDTTVLTNVVARYTS